MLYLQIIHFLASLLSVGYFPFSTLADIATDIDDKYLVCHIDLAQMHVVKHLLCDRLPHLFIAFCPNRPTLMTMQPSSVSRF